MPVIDEPLLRLSPEEREEVRATLRRGDLSPRVRERLEMVKAADLGRDLEEIAAWSGRTPRTVRRWLGAFASGGVGALAEREEWLEVIWLARYSPHPNLKEREWRYLKRDARSHLAGTLREFVDEVLARLARLGGASQDIVDKVAGWFIAGHRKAPTGRPPGRPKGAKDSRPRKPYERKNLPAAT